MNEKQKEILVITQEECAEVIQEISKCFRFGLDNMHKSGIKHREVLQTEVGDLLCMLDLLFTEGIIDKNTVDQSILNKREKLKKYSNIFN